MLGSRVLGRTWVKLKREPGELYRIGLHRNIPDSPSGYILLVITFGSGHCVRNILSSKGIEKRETPYFTNEAKEPYHLISFQVV